MKKLFRLTDSGLVLLAFNFVPLVGYLWFDWQIGHILVYYWLESGVIGIFNIIKMLSLHWASIFFFVPFFAVHYGGFMFVHSIFLVKLFIEGVPEGAGFFPYDVQALYERFSALQVGVAALAVSHGYSFIKNFFVRNERSLVKEKHGGSINAIVAQMFSPYKRIIVMHVTIIASAFAMIKFGISAFTVVLLVVLKSLPDFIAHNIEHSLKHD